MPTKPTLHVVSTIAAIAIAIPAIAITIPAVAQQATPPPAPVQKAEPTKPVAKVEKKSQGARTKRRKARHAAKSHGDDICSIVNGWRAFPVRDPSGYFNTEPLRCYRR